MNKQVYSIPIGLIDDRDRLRPISADHVAFLAASMAERGQDTPVLLAQASPAGRHKLLGGGHRVAAARDLGWAAIDAFIVEGDELAQKLTEIDENLMRRELSALDRAVFLAERKAVYEAMHPAAKKGGDRRSDQSRKLATLVAVPAFREDAAQRLGLDETSINRIIRRAELVRDLSPQQREALATHPVADSGAELDALLRLEADDRERVWDELLFEAPEKRAQTVREALKRVKGDASPRGRAAETEKQLSALVAAWGKAKHREAREQFFDFLLKRKQIPAHIAKAALS